jgi:hypothetical protein
MPTRARRRRRSDGFAEHSLAQVKAILIGGFLNPYLPREIEAIGFEERAESLLQFLGEDPRVRATAAGTTSNDLFHHRALPELPERKERGGHIPSYLSSLASEWSALIFARHPVHDQLTTDLASGRVLGAVWR